jgi:hypothetical protein
MTVVRARIEDTGPEPGSFEAAPGPGPVRLDTIVGTAGSRRDFDRHFRPPPTGCGPRWEQLALAQRRGAAIPRMADSIKGVKRIAARLARFDGAYLRFAGDLEISRYRGGELAETHQDDAIWELMYFGHARDR